MAKIQVSEELWQEFHRFVNMTSRELEDWLRVQSAGEASEALPDQAGPELSRRILSILGKRRADLSEEDIAVMESVVGRIRLERRDDLDPTAGDQAWRHRLMTLGHDRSSDPPETASGRAATSASSPTSSRRRTPMTCGRERTVTPDSLWRGSVRSAVGG